jgi:hypothetical protein
MSVKEQEELPERVLDILEKFVQIMQFIYNVDDKNDCIGNSKSDCVFEMLISEIKTKTKVLNLVN